MQPSAKVVKAPAKKEASSSEEESDDDDDDDDESDEEEAVNLDCWLVSILRIKFYSRISMYKLYLELYNLSLLCRRVWLEICKETVVLY